MRQESCTVSYPTWSINECSDFSSYAEWIETERRKRLYDSNFAITFLNKLRELFQKLSIQEQQEKKKKFFSFYEETLTVWPTWVNFFCTSFLTLRLFLICRVVCVACTQKQWK
jgi:hypothetical protein